jgi:hypothetical protein
VRTDSKDSRVKTQLIHVSNSKPIIQLARGLALKIRPRTFFTTRVISTDHHILPASPTRPILSRKQHICHRDVESSYDIDRANSVHYLLYDAQSWRAIARPTRSLVDERSCRVGIGRLRESNPSRHNQREHVFIIFDYDKSDHLDSCRELAFGIKQGITSKPVPAQYIHLTVKRMKEDNERLNTKFLYHGQLCSKARSCP